MKAELFYIYVLIDPRNGDVRYVGLCAHPDGRLYGHISESRTKKKSAKLEWIRELIESGHAPVMEVLECVKGKRRAMAVERREIQARIPTGKLTNRNGVNQKSRAIAPEFTYIGTLISTPAYKRFKTKANSLGQSVASRLRIILEKMP